ncbi:Hydroxymethylpyrimidine/phosphomethylpyrimidine kinase [Rubellimicrobium thermophilum DSM 16684]|uniref:Hydroxymethylpyrimidine/phosphomethylpyrimidine kinase n=1 Tax=Rubellimicrobium thermophilum DSM 16684 TaxID=1123069 RepID=S9S9J4_9RHOB|nr:Hydroxymethylpyrimidine/phosphomethylpyrimidine kinase [Rubellimicrobium thermophilum DSM 16684]
MIPNVLSIAGSDPSGGAGIQADIKAISACGGYGMAAITALTAQNTCGVSGVRMVAPDFVAAQIAAIRADIRIDAVKIGMLGAPRRSRRSPLRLMALMRRWCSTR